MPDVPTTPSSAFRRGRRTGSVQLLRKAAGYGGCVVEERGGQRGRRFLRWTACFAFVSRFRRAKGRDVPEDRRNGAAAVAPKGAPAEHHGRRLDADRDSIASTLLHWKDGPAPLAATPLSALSPPPRHAMKERSRSLTADDDPVVLPLPTPRKRKATTISRSLALRLSLDVDQHCTSSTITHSSSGFSHRTTSDFKVDDDTASTLSSHQQQQQRNGSALAEHKPLRLSSIEATAEHSSTADPTGLVAARRTLNRVSPITLPGVERLTPALRAQEAGGDNDDEGESDYDDLLSEFQLPSEKLPQQQEQAMVAGQPPKSKETPKEADVVDSSPSSSPSNSRLEIPPVPLVSRSTVTAKELARQQTMQALEGHFAAGSKSMDIVRDKAHYDAVVAGTMHRRPWTQYMRAQPCKEKEGEEQAPAIGRQENKRCVKAASAVFAGYTSKQHRPSLVYFPPSPNSIHSNY